MRLGFRPVGGAIFAGTAYTILRAIDETSYGWIRTTEFLGYSAWEKRSDFVLKKFVYGGVLIWIQACAGGNLDGDYLEFPSGDQSRLDQKYRVDGIS